MLRSGRDLDEVHFPSWIDLEEGGDAIRIGPKHSLAGYRINPQVVVVFLASLAFIPYGNLKTILSKPHLLRRRKS